MNTQHRKRTCLIVDDDNDTRDRFRNLLDRHRFNIRQVHDGVEALAVCRRAMPDVILVDSSVPKTGGLKFLRHLRRTTKGKLPVVLFCARSHDVRQLGAAIAGGASECLLKPFDDELLDFKLHQSGAV